MKMDHIQYNPLYNYVRESVSKQGSTKKPRSRKKIRK